MSDYTELTAEDIEIICCANDGTRQRMFQDSEEEAERLQAGPGDYADWRDYVRAGVWAGDMTEADRRAWVAASDSRAISDIWEWALANGLRCEQNQRAARDWQSLENTGAGDPDEIGSRFTAAARTLLQANDLSFSELAELVLQS